MNLIKKNIEHFENILDYIVEHLLCIVVLILIFIISFIVLKFLPFSMPKDVQSQEIYIGGISLNNVSIWFTAIGLIITAFWSIYQYTKNTSRKQQEKGANLAKEFSNSLLLKCGIVTVVYKNSRLYKILNSHREYDSFRNFTISELREVYNNDLPYIYRDLEKECKLDDIYHDILRKRITPYSKIKDNTNTEDSMNTKNKENAANEFKDEDLSKLFILDNKDFPFHFNSLVDDVLNELEYVCMDISSQAAGSKYIYQSLHQIFFRTIKILSVEICLRNNGKYCDKFYTNIIHVYNEWTSIYEKSSKKEEKRKKQVDKILNPKIKTV
jgi:hypothetical protein